MRIKHDIKHTRSDSYMLNDIRVWYSDDDNLIHVGQLSSLDLDKVDAELHALAVALKSETGWHKIDPNDPDIMKFLKVTKCLK